LFLLRYFLAEGRYQAQFTTIHGKDLLFLFFQKIFVPDLFFQDRKYLEHFQIEGWSTSYRLLLCSFRTVGRRPEHQKERAENKKQLHGYASHSYDSFISHRYSLFNYS